MIQFACSDCGCPSITVDDICREMNANQDVWLGWAAWAGGPRWPPDDMFNLEPWPDGRMREQTAILRRYAVGG
jgi:endoglucanase